MGVGVSWSWSVSVGVSVGVGYLLGITFCEEIQDLRREQFVPRPQSLVPFVYFFFKVSLTAGFAPGFLGSIGTGPFFSVAFFSASFFLVAAASI